MLKAETLGLVADTDAAMIRITDKGTYPFIDIDRTNSTRLGDWVFALGHSGGFDKTRGSVVRLGRLVRIANSTFQSDCILIGGDSGGPLFDLTGRLVGIHSRVGQQLQVNMHVPMSEFIKNWDGLLKAEFVGEGPFAQKPVKGNGFLGLATEARPDGGLRVTKVGNKSPAQRGRREGRRRPAQTQRHAAGQTRTTAGTAQGNVRRRRGHARTRTRRQNPNPNLQPR